MPARWSNNAAEEQLIPPTIIRALLFCLFRISSLFTTSFGEEVYRPFVYDLKNIVSHLSFRLRMRFLTPFESCSKNSPTHDLGYCFSRYLPAFVFSVSSEPGQQ